ncbi:hypothetical protein BpHYR1_019828 [Brachionus plicatilis]|uniref:Uncharacterized protein n=1 Tax=Brachionus plicatilis TaxID=10195 RepID=A0A3M7PH64_BRAPC|nr:hypothetical protein BpHYR1_019828 [Brachionus plicatilis]
MYFPKFDSKIDEISSYVSFMVISCYVYTFDSLTILYKGIQINNYHKITKFSKHHYKCFEQRKNCPILKSSMNTSCKMCTQQNH